MDVPLKSDCFLGQKRWRNLRKLHENYYVVSCYMSQKKKDRQNCWLQFGPQKLLGKENYELIPKAEFLGELGGNSLIPPAVWSQNHPQKAHPKTTEPQESQGHDHFQRMDVPWKCCLQTPLSKNQCQTFSREFRETSINSCFLRLPEGKNFWHCFFPRGSSLGCQDHISEVVVRTQTRQVG